ncbi:MAG: glycosyl transferase family 1 [Bacteroidetes bacterium MedPE-SWsnd-G2]|nr:MAG: glycosyl transferase family 1 [Bacteroidetes bacterium MedPE-SWsnd-G2]
MKILLLGEYSRLHNSLKEGLEQLNHDVTIAGTSDYFKNYPTDILFKTKYTSGVLGLIRKLIFKLSGVDITSLDLKKQFQNKQTELENYDIVQLINECPINTVPKIEGQLLDFIFKANKNVFLLSCGTDHISVKYAADGHFKYSVLTPYEQNRGSKKDFWHVIMYLTAPYEKHHKFVYKNIRGVIATDFDYHIPLEGHPKYLGFIPNPINVEKLKFSKLDFSSKLVIFHGINSSNYYKKGNDIFEQALDLLSEESKLKVEIITVRSLPYIKYIETFNRAHIVLDQVFSYDQGYNALEAMAKGKVVFTGAETPWLSHFNLEADTVAINAEPNAKVIASKLESLINNPEQLQTISNNARAFIEREHNYIKIAETYLKVWNSSLKS